MLAGFDRRQRNLVAIVLAASLLVLIGLAVGATSLTVDPVVSIVGGGTAAFGGAYFAFYLQRSAARADELRRLKISALERIEAIIGERNKIGEGYSSIIRVPFAEIRRFAQRVDNADLGRIAADLEISCRELAHEIERRNEDVESLGPTDLIAEVYLNWKLMADVVERLLLDHYGLKTYMPLDQDTNA